MYPQREFSRAIRTTKATSTSPIAGLPVRWGVGPSSASEAAMPAQDRVRGDQAAAPQCAGAAAARARRTRPDPPSPGAVVGWRGAGWTPRAAARGARCACWRTGDPTAGPAPAADRRSSKATAATCWDHVRPAIIAGQRPRIDFWHPAASTDPGWAYQRVRGCSLKPLVSHRAGFWHPTGSLVFRSIRGAARSAGRSDAPGMAKVRDLGG